MDFFNMLNALNSSNATTSSDYISRMTVNSEVVEKLISSYEIRAMNTRSRRGNKSTQSTLVAEGEAAALRATCLPGRNLDQQGELKAETPSVPTGVEKATETSSKAQS